jgi:predicted RNase H-related nuclease YkuK (DUF458 family)
VSSIELAAQAIADSSPDSAVYLGCDSDRFKRNVNGKSQWFARYSTVVVLHYSSSRGCRLFHDTVEMSDYGSLKQRMLTEVGLAVEHALKLVDVIGDRHFEIHCDVNKDPKHKSFVALSEARGYVLGTLGFEPKFKPDAWAATHCSDHVVRGKLKT